ncbi:Apoptosis regulatory protein Siva [Eufriesea mexicana]|uniref:Apoptosis regulatory protein Siva n=1 Tax=Eufriesea mexicana TaxID=516756 RepID=A0A310SII5_9HYME|nr:PREDICTED: apoptosis regulatory protein Siva-like [Eufriesea mexicana]XP_017754629.1 PREDICTED: apoptosis regulatory protein Siva-like [Eufriesea mexicana]OAD58766.1 Apoptosis regulatory protein Siva [Eufriesea mexicana]
MPKRPCPFEDDLPPQLKVHVGEKQVNNGVCREERMKSVYGKTMDLLKDGVKKLSQKLPISMELNPIIPSNVPPSKVSSCKSKNTLKQMVLNSKLELLRMDKAIKDVQPKYDLCDCSRVIDQSMFSKCSYCDHILCNSCLIECINCSELFCQNCFVPIYGQEEQNKCLNCYK